MERNDKISNKSQETRGRVEKSVGKATGDPEMEARGRTNQAAGGLKLAVQKIRDAFKR
ncbi:MAG TPA: CsbD family protein [Mycobacterium sp.]